LNGYALWNFLQKLVPSGIRSVDEAGGIDSEVSPLHAPVGV
jgi:hypothetical protein